MTSAPMQSYPKGSKADRKVKTVVGEFKRGNLHSGSKYGPEVMDMHQAVAIAPSQARTVMGKRRG